MAPFDVSFLLGISCDPLWIEEDADKCACVLLDLPIVLAMPFDETFNFPIKFRYKLS
jgi:hypothetical protein